MQEDETAVSNFIDRYDLSYPFLLDKTGSIGGSYNIFTTPTTFFINPDGVIESVLPGLVSLGWLDQQMAALEA